MSSPDDTQPISILIVDDDALDRAAVRRALRSAGLDARVRELDHSDAIMAAVAADPPNCIILDYWLPGTDGLAVLQHLRASGVAHPIIVMTGQGDEQLAVEIMKAGASDYLPKSQLSPERLSNSLRYTMRVWRAEAERLRTEERLRFLAGLSQLLVSSLDHHENLRELAQMVVPTLADWCTIDITEPDGAIRRLVSAASEPLAGKLGKLTLEHAALDRDAPSGPAFVIRTGSTQYFTSLSDEQLADLPEKLRQALVAGELASLICVPLSVRGGVLGAITFARGARAPYDESDLAFAEEVARRAALAVDNALLYHEAQDAIRTRDAFLSVAAHELKNPLTAVIGYADLLRKQIEQRPEASERELRMANSLLGQTLRLDKLISLLLDLSRLNVGQFSVERRPMDIAALVRRVVDEMAPTLERHPLTLEVPEGPMHMMGDELRLEQVLQNLVQNAAKYSPPGNPVTVRLARQGAQIRLEVEDEGYGIPREALPRIFWRFYRASNSQQISAKGIGIGLYVVRQIVELHGGRVEVESTENVGSTFTVWLPAV